MNVELSFNVLKVEKKQNYISEQLRDSPICRPQNETIEVYISHRTVPKWLKVVERLVAITVLNLQTQFNLNLFMSMPRLATQKRPWKMC